MNELIDNPAKVLLVGEPATGKSTSMQGLTNHERVLYINTEIAKSLPYSHKFKEVKLSDPEYLEEALDRASVSNSFDTVVIDSLSCLMEHYFKANIYKQPKTRAFDMWEGYSMFLIELFEEQAVRCPKNMIFTSHSISDSKELADGSLVKTSKAAIKGSVGKKGVEYFFSTVCVTKVLPVSFLEKFADKTNLLNITEAEKNDGYKHVIQTRRDAGSIHEIIRAPVGMWSADETYIDSNAQLILDRIHKFYDVKPTAAAKTATTQS